MKKLIIVIIVSLFALAGNAQWSYKFLSKKKHFLYTSGDFIVGNQSSGKLSLNYVYNNKYTVNVGFTATTKDEATLPSEILKSATELTSVNATPAFTNAESLHIMAGRVYKLNHDGTFRLLVQGGPGIYTRRAPLYTITSNSYKYDMQATKALCLVLNPKVEIPLWRTIGVSAGPMAVLNKDEQYIGAGIGIMYGIIGKD